MRRMAMVAVVAVLTIGLTACSRSKKAGTLELSGLGSPAEVAAKALVDRAEVTSLAGEGAYLGSAREIGSWQGESGMPLVRDLKGSPTARRTEGRSFDVKGSKGTATLWVEMKQKGDGPWKLESWGVESAEVTRQNRLREAWRKVKEVPPGS